MDLINAGNLISVGTMLAAVAGLAAAYVAWLAARAARDAVRMQVVLDFSRRDAAPEMGTAIKALWKFAKEDDHDLTKRFKDLEKSDPQRWTQIDDFRRTVHKFYLQLMQAYQAKLISEREIITCFYKHQFDTVLDVIYPLEQAKPGSPYTPPVFEEYRRLRDNYKALYSKYLGDPAG